MQEQTGWTIETLRTHLLSIITERDTQLRAHADANLETSRLAREQLIILIEEHDKRYTQRFDAQQQAMSAALAAAEKAVSKAETASEKRFESVNEFRAALGDQTRDLMPRAEVEARFGSLTEKIDGPNGVMRRIERSAGRGAGLADGWGYLVGAVGLIAAVVALFIKLH